MREVVKWDDSTNEIIVLAKKMCIIMMEMTDFTRGRGPLNSTMEVIQASWFGFRDCLANGFEHYICVPVVPNWHIHIFIPFHVTASFNLTDYAEVCNCTQIACQIEIGVFVCK